MKFDRQFQGFLNQKQIKVNSFDMAEKIQQGTLESSYEFRFEATKEIENNIRKKTEANEKINFKVYVKNDEIINVNLVMKSSGFAVDFNLNDDKMEYCYKIISVVNN